MTAGDHMTLYILVCVFGAGVYSGVCVTEESNLIFTWEGWGQEVGPSPTTGGPWRGPFPGLHCEDKWP